MLNKSRDKKYEKKYDRTYRKLADKYPSVISKEQLDLLTRSTLIRQEYIKAGIMFFGGIIVACIISYILPMLQHSSSFVRFIISVLQISTVISLFGGIIVFARPAKNSLTPSESSKVYRLKAMLNGKKDMDIPSEAGYLHSMDNENQNYENASFFKKLKILFIRIPNMLKFVIILLISMGIILSAFGAYNILTYEQRNKNAVNVQAVVVDIESTYDDDQEKMKYSYEYEYTYNGKTYKTSDNSYVKMAMGSTKTFLIDSEKPWKVINNDGNEMLTVGIILLCIGIFILAYTMMNMRNPNNQFSIFSFFWFIFFAAAIGFAVWGLVLILDGNMAGLGIILIGCPLWLLGMFMFRYIFNKK